MTTTMSSVEFPVSASLSLGKIKSTFQQKLQCILQSSEQLEICCLDTFDWRLFEKGLILEKYDLENTSCLKLRKLNSVDHLCSEIISGNVEFAWQLPDGRLKPQLSRIIKMRALMPMVWLMVKRYQLARLDRNQKTVSRVILEGFQVYDPELDTYKRLQKRLLLQPVRGYPASQQEVVAFVQSQWQLEIAQQDIVAEALDMLGLQPFDYTTKSKVKLSAEMNSETAVKDLLREMLDIMEANEEGICDDIDSEFLHDYRVAVRKTRSAFNQAAAVISQQELEKHKKNFSWLGSVTGPARDMDVYLLKFDSYRKMLPVELQDSLLPLHKLLEKKKRLTYNVLKRTLNSKRYQAFKTSYREFLDTPPAIGENEVYSNQPVKTVADQRIWKVFKKVIKEGEAININSPPEDLHELRITCKRLRYLIEFFQSLYDPKQINQLIKAMKKLQNNLGEYNDLHVQAEKLTEFSHELVKQKSFAGESKTAMKMLVKHLEELQELQRADFAKRFEQFSNRDVRQKFKTMFKPKQTRGEVS